MMEILFSWTEKSDVLWASSVSVFERNSTAAVLSDNGNLVLRTINPTVVWQSFDYPGNTFLSGMKVWLNLKTGQSMDGVPWKDVDDPSLGPFTGGIDPRTPRQLIIWRGTDTYWRDSVWETKASTGVYDLQRSYVSYFTIVANDDEVSFLITFPEKFS